MQQYECEARRETECHDEDFRDENTVVERFFLDRGDKVHFIPKFHCEMNPIERVWGQAKRYTCTYTNFTLPGLRAIIEPALYSVTLDHMRKYFRKAREYERVYVEGHKAALRTYKSHHRIFSEKV